jgi:hypothetical protein
MHDRLRKTNDLRACNSTEHDSKKNELILIFSTREMDPHFRPTAADLRSGSCIIQVILIRDESTGTPLD